MRQAAVRPVEEGDWPQVERLISDYLAGLPFTIDFQDLERELADLPNEYGPPGGAALLAWRGDEAVGLAAVRRFDERDAELKRMYVEPGARGLGLGERLAAAAIDEARRLGYRRLLLDTVDSMQPAIAIYRRLGFAEVEAYRHNPLPGARWFGLIL